jgi:hypothetical protein
MMESNIQSMKVTCSEPKDSLLGHHQWTCKFIQLTVAKHLPKSHNVFELGANGSNSRTQVLYCYANQIMT